MATTGDAGLPPASGAGGGEAPLKKVSEDEDVFDFQFEHDGSTVDQAEIPKGKHAAKRGSPGEAPS
eukprot:11300494-Alexandrium_andersonii.AAC.1